MLAHHLLCFCVKDNHDAGLVLLMLAEPVLSDSLKQTKNTKFHAVNKGLEPMMQPKVSSGVFSPYNPGILLMDMQQGEQACSKHNLACSHVFCSRGAEHIPMTTVALLGQLKLCMVMMT